MKKTKQCTKCNMPISWDYTMCTWCYNQYTKNTKKNGTVDYQDYVNINTSPKDRKIYDIGDIWDNSIRCNDCGGIARSKNRHDRVPCKCKKSWVDGGSWYSHFSGPCEWVGKIFNILHKGE